jgi:hypothetical protein
MLLSTLPAAGAASLAAAPVVVSRNLALKKLDYKVPLQVGLLAATQLVLSLSLFLGVPERTSQLVKFHLQELL